MPTRAFGRATQKEAEALTRHSGGGVLRTHYSTVRPKRPFEVQEAVGEAVLGEANSRITAEREIAKKAAGAESLYEANNLHTDPIGRREGIRTPTGYYPNGF